MRVLMLSKACLVGIYQKKLEAIARQPDVSAFKVLVPPYWKDERGVMWLERSYTEGYDLQETPMRFNGNFHFHYYPEFPRLAKAFQPDIVHIDEEPYNLATWLALRVARRNGAKALVFSWQNINRRYPLPFRWGEGWVLRNIDYLIAGTESAGEVWREKGYEGPAVVIPQFGVDPDLFPLRTANRHQPSAISQPFQIGYVGRLVYEKGVDLLLGALASLPDYEWGLTILGSGPEESNLRRQVERLALRDRVQFVAQVPSAEIGTYYRRFDALVLPSRTMPNWKEQFGRVLIEAMSGGTVVIGSDSGAIPGVIGDAGLIFRENNAADLAEKLRLLFDDPERCQNLAERGRGRVLDHFTQEQIAAKTVAVYREMMGLPG